MNNASPAPTAPVSLTPEELQLLFAIRAATASGRIHPDDPSRGDALETLATEDLIRVVFDAPSGCGGWVATPDAERE